MTDTLATWLTLGLTALLLVVSLVAARLYQHLRASRAMLVEATGQKNRLINLIGAAALAKGGTLRVPCREPNFSVPGVNIERKGNSYAVTVQGGPHL